MGTIVKLTVLALALFAFVYIVVTEALRDNNKKFAVTVIIFYMSFHVAAYCALISIFR